MHSLWHLSGLLLQLRGDAGENVGEEGLGEGSVRQVGGALVMAKTTILWPESDEQEPEMGQKRPVYQTASSRVFAVVAASAWVSDECKDLHGPTSV